MTWETNKQVVTDGWYLMFMSLDATSEVSTGYVLEGLDSLQSVFWGDALETGVLPDGSAEHIDALLQPLVAVRASYAPFVHDQEKSEWAAWSKRLDALLSIRYSDDYSLAEKALLIAAECVHGIAPRGGVDGVPLVTIPFTLIRASKVWHDSEAWWLDVLNALAKIGNMAIEGMERADRWLGDKVKPISNGLMILGGAVLVATLIAAMVMVSSDDVG